MVSYVFLCMISHSNHLMENFDMWLKLNEGTKHSGSQGSQTVPFVKIGPMPIAPAFYLQAY